MATRVDVHHRDQDERNGHPSNLRKRCEKCHLEGEHDRPDDVEVEDPVRTLSTRTSRREPERTAAMNSPLTLHPATNHQ